MGIGMNIPIDTDTHTVEIYIHTDIYFAMDVNLS